MSKQVYTAPTTQVIRFESADVICTSGLGGEGGQGEEPP